MNPADWTWYPPDSGEGQGHSARFVSSGIQGLRVSRVKKKKNVVNHLECQDQTQTEAAVLCGQCFWKELSTHVFCSHAHWCVLALLVPGLT